MSAAFDLQLVLFSLGVRNGKVDLLWLLCFLQMSNITVTYRDGRVAQLEQVYIRGSKIRFLILPDMLKNAPMLKSMKNKNQGSGAGRGKAAILKAQGKSSVLCCTSGMVQYSKCHQIVQFDTQGRTRDLFLCFSQSQNFIKACM